VFEANDWRSQEIALLGSLPDDEVAALLGRSTESVRVNAQAAWHSFSQGSSPKTMTPML
jgi:hypothetical protein